MSLSEEETDFLRLVNLVVKVAPQAVRYLFDQRFPPADLTTVLQNNLLKLNKLKSSKVINAAQWDLLFPPSGDTTTSTTYDVTLLICLLRNIVPFGSPSPAVARPSTGFDQLPQTTDSSEGADLARIKHYRNHIAHNKDATIGKMDFNVAWWDLCEAIRRLGAGRYDQDCSDLRVASLDRFDREVCRDMIKTLIEEELDKTLKDYSVALTDHTATLADHSSTLTDHSTTIANHSATLTDNTATLTDHSATLADHSATLTDHSATLTDHSATLSDHSTTIANHSTTLTDNTATLTDHSATLTDHSATLSDHSATLSDHTATLTDHSGTLADHSETLTDNTATLTDHTSMLAVHSATLAKQTMNDQEKTAYISKLEKKIDELDSSIPMHMKEKYQSYIEQWQEDEVTFTVTRATEQVTRLVQENGVVLVTGSSGSGKSSIIHHVALELQSKEKYDVIPIVSSPADIVQYRDLKKNQVFVIDDFCGKNFINEQDLQTWKEQADQIEQLFLSENKNRKDAKSDKKGVTYGRMIILISCRLQISKDARFESMKMFNKPSVDLQSKNYCLLPKERHNMISKYTTLSEYNLQIMDKVMDKCSFFPLLCKMSKGKQVEQLTELFTSPVDSIKNDIKDMIENKHFEFCALVLCVLFPNELEESYMNPRTTPENVKVKVTEIVANFDINLKIELKRKQLVDTFHKLDGTYIKKTGSVYSIAHDKLYDMVAVTCGQKLVELFIEYSPSSFIAERFKLKSGQNLEQDDSFLYLSDDTEIVYFDRIFRDLKEQDGKSFFDNQQLKEKRYKDKVMGYIKEHTDSCKQLFLELDDDKYRSFFNKRKFYTSTPMIEASKIGFYELVKYLISIKCNVNTTDRFGFSPLYHSYENGHVNIVQLLITNGVNIQYVLWEACYHGDINTVRMCLDRNVDVSQCSSGVYGHTPLYGACVRGHIDIVRLLLDRNADVSQCSSGVYGHTPLYGACVRGHIDIVRLLLDRNADVSQCSSGVYGHTPLYGACLGGHIDIVRLLLQNNADPTQRIRWGHTPLDLVDESIKKLLRSYIKH